MADAPSPAADIRVPDIAHVRKYPGMYISGVDQRGLHVMLRELLGRSLASGGPRTTGSLHVTLNPDGSVEIADDSWWLQPEMRGIELRQLETVVLRFMRGPSPFPSRWLGFANGIASALSEWFTVEVRHAGRRCRQAFRRGEPTSDPVITRDPGASSLTVAFKPDPLIFGVHRFDPDTIRDQLRECAFVHGGVRLTLSDRIGERRDSFHYPDGIRAHVEWLDEGRHPLHPDPLVVRGTRDGVRFEVGLRWCEEHDRTGGSYANGEPTHGEGTEVTGVLAAVSAALNEFIRKHTPQVRELQGDEPRLGLTTAVSVWLANPEYEGATKARLSNDALRWAVGSAVGEFLRDTFDANPALAGRVIAASVARPHDVPMTDAEWEASADPRRMLRIVGARGTRRRTVLFAAACYRRGGETHGDTLFAAMEAYADGELEREKFRRTPVTGAGMRQVRSAVAAADFSPRDAGWLVTHLNTRDVRLLSEQAALVRDIFGNPNRELAVDPSWRTSTVLALARSIDADRAFDLMPILADALQDAGCDAADVLDHCRGPGPHARGCWVIDLLLGRE